MNNIEENITENLKVAIEAEKIDPIKLSEETGIEEERIYKFLISADDISVNEALKLSEFFKVYIDYFFSNEHGLSHFLNEQMKYVMDILPQGSQKNLLIAIKEFFRRPEEQQKTEELRKLIDIALKSGDIGNLDN